MRAFLLALIALVFLPLAAVSPAHAQVADRPNTILVLDGSGSMWGQIDGVNKIVIARNVIADMLADMADDVSLGLTVYGHRERGACGDIETIVAPAPFTQDRILDAVNAINPRGRTPMTDAVIAAAQALRSTEEAATVILVSDGIENCNPDPCAMAAELEASGVDFTAHVIGFDVASEPEARAQMQCIADNTGGQFLTADNAAELGDALNQVVAIAPVQTTLQAVVTPDMTTPTRDISWTLLDVDGAALTAPTTAPAIAVALAPGTYVAQATRSEPTGPVPYLTTFTVEDGTPATVQVPMPAIVETAPLSFTARVEPDMTVPASPLNWTLYDADGTAVLGPLTAPAGTANLLPGDYRLTVERVTTGTVHEATFTMAANTPQEVTIPLPALSVDIDLVARIGDVGGVTITDPIIWEVTPLDPAPEIAMTNPTRLSLTRGAYRVTAYWTAQEVEETLDFVVLDQAREIIVVFPEPAQTATLTTVATAPVAADIDVAWEGPGAQGDMLLIHDPDTGRLLTVASVTENPQSLRLPGYPGRYDITYRQSAGNGPIIGTTPIEVTDTAATLTAPDTIGIGDLFDVTWEGPGYDMDRIALVPVGETAHPANGRALMFGNPIDITAPTAPGSYELQYILREDARVIGTRPIEVVDVQATLTAPDSAVAGDTIEVGVTGPENNGDFIAIAPAGAEGYHRFANTSRVEGGGGPLDLLMPTTPGEYTLSYVLNSDRSDLVTRPLTVTPAAGTLTAPATATAGDTIEVAYTGPAYADDFIAITPVDADGYHRFANSTRLDRDDNPLDLLMPTETGEYLIEYVFGQDRTALTTAPITVVDAAATLTAPATAVAGSTIEVAYTGPAYADDFIGITRVGEDGYHRFANSTRLDRSDNPLDLLMPTETGEYIIEYVVGQDRSTLATQAITVVDAAATLTAPATATAGSTLEVGYTGPGYADDFIGITRVGDEGYHRFDQTARLDRGGNPLDLQMPTEPGEYVLEYVVGQDRTALVTQPIAISELGATLTAPQTAVAGSTIEVGWTGPDYAADFIAITPADAEGYHRFANSTRTSTGAPLDLLMPTTPGDYVLEYVLGQDRTNLTTVPVTVTSAQATLTAPASAPAGTTVEIAWTGPDYAGDFLALTPADAEGYHRFTETASVADGAPARLQLPGTPGSYVIEYVLGQDRTRLTSVAFEVTEDEASLTAPATAVAGETIEIAWTGPNNDGDYIGVGPVGADGSAGWQHYAYTEAGDIAAVQMPIVPGDYEISYFLRSDRSRLVSSIITLSEVSAVVTAPETAAMGSTIQVGWTGPDYAGDYIGIGRVGATGAATYERYAYTSDGATVDLDIPTTPGTYVIGYYARQERRLLGAVEIDVTAVDAALTAPDSAIAGATIEVAWSGPDYDGDYIAIGRVGATGSALYETYTYTSDGSPLSVTVPATPGAYVIRYFIRQDRVELAALPLTVE